jgi:hypothetical protein
MSVSALPVKIIFDANDDPSGFGEFVAGDDHIPSGLLQLSSVGNLLDLSSLNDVSSYPDAASGYVVTFVGASDGTFQILPSAASADTLLDLHELTDASTYPDVVDGEVLTWSGTTWIASANDGVGAGGGGGVSSLSSLLDVSSNILPINKDGLVWNGTEWTASSVLFADGSVSTTGDIVFGGDLHFSPSGIVSSVGAIQFHLTPGTVHSEGLLHWSDDDKALDIDTEIADFHVTLGQQEVIRVINKTGLTVSAGQCVHVSGVQGNNPTIGLTNASAINNQNLFGVVNKDISNNNAGYITTFGMVRDIDTSLWSPADILFLSTTDGLLSTTQPLAPDHKAKIAVVVTSNATEGQMFVHTEPFSQAEVSSIHDVSSYPDIATGQVLTWSGTQWIASSNEHLTDHGALTGLSDDDHTQYLLTDGTRILTGNQNFGGLVADNYGPLSSTLSAVNSTEYLAGTETNYRVWGPNDISGAIWSFAGSSADIMKYEMANGVVSGGAVTAHSTNISAVDVASGTAIFWLSALETSKKINFGATELVISGIPTNTVTHLCINPDGTFSQESTAPTGEDRRNCVSLAQIGHSDNTQVRGIVNRHDVALNIGSQLRDLATAVGTINLGVRLAADSAGNLQLDRSAGTLVRLGDNWSNNPYRPSESDISASANISFRLRTQTGLGSNNNLNLDVGNYDNGGTVTAITGTKYQNFRAYQLPNGNLVIQYGQNLYNTLTNAEEGIATETFTLLENLTDSAVLISVISVASNATDLTNTNQAAFTTPTKFGDWRTSWCRSWFFSWLS